MNVFAISGSADSIGSGAASRLQDGTDDARTVRRRGLRRQRLAAGGSAALCVIASFIAALGYLPVAPVLVVSGYCLTGNLFFYWLQWSGRSAGFRDPACVLTSQLFSVSVLLLGCALIPQDRPASLQLFLLIWALDVARLSRHEQLVSAAFALLGLVALLAGSWLLDCESDPETWRRSRAALAVTLVYLPGLIAIGHTVQRARDRQSARRLALAEALVQLQTLSERDVLTGVSNRRHAQEVLEREASRQSRTGRAFSVCVLDLDHFKRINDFYGHATGDAALVATARLLREMLPEGCTIARWGGEEFLVLLPDTDAAPAGDWLRRARTALATATLLDCPPGLTVDFSAGICAHRTSDPVATTVARADQALYRAKADGRGRVVIQAGEG